MAGSIAPDFEYFLKMSSGHIHSHTFYGVFYFDLPVSVAISLIFHLIVREPLADHLPAFLKKRILFKTDFNFLHHLKKNYPVFTVCVITGAFSHLGWDLLTHNSWLIKDISLYHMFSLKIGEERYPLFYVLQQVSTIIGTGAVLFYLYRQTDEPPAAERKRLGVPWFWPVVVVCTILIFCIRFSRAAEFPELGDSVVTLISATLLSLTAVSVAYKRKNKIQN